ncbi:putative Glycylpeptide N-tetradecanoyltransferase [Glarea lozoyensis 74030]|uniref:Glycylpeptide N-tetradecanoyltransferase n=1 Tax=Glarea lozoyensis (strain ATCC 74030 / MF5533) TaxID=1104152 RepID=H0EI23_GLAL7|nr:putative Glycylpeptide N-tetradecanoyltransferase [Glarea lozoyensis 74030]
MDPSIPLRASTLAQNQQHQSTTRMNNESKIADPAATQDAVEEVVKDAKASGSVKTQIESDNEDEEHETTTTNTPASTAAAKKKKSKKKRIKDALTRSSKDEASGSTSAQNDMAKAMGGLNKEQIQEILKMNPGLAQDLGVGSSDPNKVAADFKKLNLEDILAGLASSGKNVKDMAGYKFWQTQPVPKLGEKGKIEKEGPIRETDLNLVRKEPYPMAENFEWVTMDMLNDEELKEIQKYKLPDHTSTKGLRPMEEKDIDAVLDLLTRYLARFDMAPQFSREEVIHWLVHKKGEYEEQVIWSYVVEDPSTKKITDYFSFYCLESSVINNPRHSNVRAAYLFYYATETVFAPKSTKGDLKIRLNQLINDALILAKKFKFDVFNALTLQDNYLYAVSQINIYRLMNLYLPLDYIYPFTIHHLSRPLPPRNPLPPLHPLPRNPLPPLNPLPHKIIMPPPLLKHRHMTHPLHNLRPSRLQPPNQLSTMRHTDHPITRPVHNRYPLPPH